MPYDAARGTGRTQAMVTQIPEGGAILVVHNRNMERYLRDLIFAIHGKPISDKCEVIVVIDQSDVDRVHRTFLSNCNRRAPKPVMVDHAFHNGVIDWRVHERLGEFMDYFEIRYKQETSNGQ